MQIPSAAHVVAPSGLGIPFEKGFLFAILPTFLRGLSAGTTVAADGAVATGDLGVSSACTEGKRNSTTRGAIRNAFDRFMPTTG